MLKRRIKSENIFVKLCMFFSLMLQKMKNDSKKKLRHIIHFVKNVLKMLPYFSVLLHKSELKQNK